MNKENLVEIFCGISIILFLIMVSFTILHDFNLEEYKTNEKVNCYDGYRNEIEDAVCYETIFCVPNEKFLSALNSKECREFLR